MRRSPDAQRLLAEYRRDIEPTQEQLDDVRDRLDSDRRSPPSRIVLGIVLTAAAALLVTWWAARSASMASDPIEAPVQAPHEHLPVPNGGQSHERLPRPALPRAVTPTPPPESTATQSSAPLRRRPLPAAPPVDMSESPSLRLAAEAKLIRRAEARLRNDDAAGALELLQTHARTFADGALIAERRALRAIALCRVGKQAQGRGEAATLEGDPAVRPYRERIDEACK